MIKFKGEVAFLVKDCHQLKRVVWKIHCGFLIYHNDITDIIAEGVGAGYTEEHRKTNHVLAIWSNDGDYQQFQPFDGIANTKPNIVTALDSPAGVHYGEAELEIGDDGRVSTISLSFKDGLNLLEEAYYLINELRETTGVVNVSYIDTNSSAN